MCGDNQVHYAVFARNNIFVVIELTRKGRVRHVAGMGEMKNAYKF